ncbi:MAG: hypothetical protein IPM34_07910 [Saprospiraceae bacterium]|nr:hypothetical protein [Saprospiraceae bacterium]
MKTESSWNKYYKLLIGLLLFYILALGSLSLKYPAVKNPLVQKEMR